MEYKKSWKTSTLPDKKIRCKCGGEAKLVTRRNYPFGKMSKARYIRAYVCNKCNEQQMLKRYKPKGGRR